MPDNANMDARMKEESGLLQDNLANNQGKRNKTTEMETV